MANSSAQLEKEKRGFKTPILQTDPEVIGQLQKDISDAFGKLRELIAVQREVEISLWSELRQSNK